MADFFPAFLKLMGHEGGYVNHPSDPGGETKYGISKRVFPDEDIPNLTLDRAMELARIHYWNAMNLDQIKDQRVATQLLDGGFNAGPGQAGKWLQRACNLVSGTELLVDGVIGPKTLEAVNTSRDQTALWYALILQQAKHYEVLATDEGKDDPDRVFIRGWLKRIFS